ncbi:Enzyme that catalyzes the fourth step in the histidine pathway [Pleurotus pulmonarius]|nr:Enzyme that catalyzes the fourth step in the histidine pathway [Pleurotus pulmonarius]
MATTQFRPCIDLHDGKVKQIVGGTLTDHASEGLKTNFVSNKSASEFAQLYRDNGLEGGHVIMLGKGNEEAAMDALRAWPGMLPRRFSFHAVIDERQGGLQVGGGINETNASKWIEAGASKVIVTSYLFPNGKFSLDRLKDISTLVGKERLVVDVSCRRRDDKWIVAMNKWQDPTDMEVNEESLSLLSEYCSEFLIHAADVEGLCQGIDEELVEKLGQWVRIPTSYAGGAKDIRDMDLVDKLSEGRVDLTFGSALDIFGGTLVNFEELVRRNFDRKEY